MENIVLISTVELQNLIDNSINSAIKNFKPEQTKQPENKLLTRNEFCQKFDISLTTCWYWEKQGRINPKRIGRRLYFSEKDIQNLLS